MERLTLGRTLREVASGLESCLQSDSRLGNPVSCLLELVNAACTYLAL